MLQRLIYQVSFIQEGIKRYKDEGKSSTMKEIINLIENDCFGETDYSNPSQEVNDKTLQILMFMILKRNELLK